MTLRNSVMCAPDRMDRPHRVHVFLDGGGHDLLRGLVQPGVDDLDPGVAQRPGHHLGPAVMAVQPSLRDDHPDLAHAAKGNPVIRPLSTGA